MLGAVRPEVRVEPAARPAASGRPLVPRGAHRAGRVAPRAGGVRAARPDRRRRGRQLAVALDEFQAIGSFNGGSVEHALRAAVQHQRQVGYVFSGSEPA